MSTVNKTIAALALALIANEVFTGDNNDNVTQTGIAPTSDVAVNALNNNAEPTLTAADIIKNPGISVNATGLPTTMSRRQSVTYDEIQYTSAGRILKNGNLHCSGNAVVIEEYNTIPDSGVLVSSAGHCFENRLPSDQYTFVMDFVNAENVIQTHTFSHPLIWDNPRLTPGVPEADKDQALIFFSGLSLPEEITPARLEIHSEHIVRDFGEWHFDYIDVTAAGFSQDMFGLSRDTNCRIRTIYTIPELSSYLGTTCQIYKGGSGSGLIFNNFENEDPNQITIGAITATVDINREVVDDGFSSYYSLFYHHTLAEVPFLQRKDICARVTAESGLNVRSENYNEPDSVRSSLPFNEVVYVTDMLYDEQEQYGADNVWLQIRNRNNPDTQAPDGYSNSVWLEETPCPPTPAP